jgi:hypothetical protein
MTEPNSVKIAGLNKIQIILEFKIQDDANKLFEQLRKDLTKLGERETYYDDPHKKSLQVFDTLRSMGLSYKRKRD